MSKILSDDRKQELSAIANRYRRVCGTTLGDLIWVYSESEEPKGKEYSCYLIGRMTGMHNNLFEGEGRILEDHWDFAENLFLPFVGWSKEERVCFLEFWVENLDQSFPEQVKREYLEAIDRQKA